MSISDPCGCEWSSNTALAATGVVDKLDMLRREALRAAREWERYGHHAEGAEWREVAKLLGGIR